MQNNFIAIIHSSCSKTSQENLYFYNTVKDEGEDDIKEINTYCRICLQKLTAGLKYSIFDEIDSIKVSFVDTLINIFNIKVRKYSKY